MLLSLLRTRISNDATLNNYWQAQYGKDAKHFIGYKRAPSTNDFPYISYVSTKSTISKGKVSELKVSLVIGVNEPGITDDVFNGVSQLDIIQDLIIQALIPLRLDANYSITAGELFVNYDLSIRHPYHEREIQLIIKRRT